MISLHGVCGRELLKSPRTKRELPQRDHISAGITHMCNIMSRMSVLLNGVC